MDWQMWQMAVSCISWKSSAVTMVDGGIFWISFGSAYWHLEARNHWWLWHSLFIDLAGDIFISQVCIVKAIVFPVVMYRCESWTYKEGWALKNRSSRIMVHKTWKSILNIHWKDWCWSWSSNTWVTWCWERLKPKAEGSGRGWDD